MQNFAIFINFCIFMTQVNLHSIKTVEYALDNANMKNAKGYNGDDQIPPPTSNPTDNQGDDGVVTENLAEDLNESEEDAWTLSGMDDDLFWRIVNCWLAIFFLILLTFQTYLGYKLVCVQLPTLRHRQWKMKKLVDKRMLAMKKYQRKLARVVTINELKGAKAKEGEGKILKY